MLLPIPSVFNCAGMPALPLPAQRRAPEWGAPIFQGPPGIPPHAQCHSYLGTQHPVNCRLLPLERTLDLLATEMILAGQRVKVGRVLISIDPDVNRRQGYQELLSFFLFLGSNIFVEIL